MNTQFSNMCRVCLVDDSSSSSVLYSLADKETRKMLFECTSVWVEPGDTYPQQICALCWNQCKTCSVFQSMARKSDRQLRQAKEEEQEEEHILTDEEEEPDYVEVLYVPPEEDVGEEENHPENQEFAEGNESSREETPATNDKKMLHTSEGSFRSGDCDKRLKMKVNLNGHKLRRSQAGYELAGYFRQFICEDCDLKFKTKRELNEHQLTHPPVQQIFECDACGLEFDEQLTMINHRRTHANKETRLKCKMCGRRFVNEGSYHLHMKTQH